jgi:hypothetical protein
MNSGNNGKNSKAKRSLRNRVVRAVFASAESMGVSDRDMIEGLAEQVISRLAPALPGWEHLTPDVKTPIEESQIMSIARSILAREALKHLSRSWRRRKRHRSEL